MSETDTNTICKDKECENEEDIIMPKVNLSDVKEKLNLKSLLYVLKDRITNVAESGLVGYDVKLQLLNMPIIKVPQLKLTDLLREQPNNELTATLRAGSNTAVTDMETAIKIFEHITGDKLEDIPRAYKVKKIDKVSGQVVFEKEFESRKQASDYVNSIAKDYPEIIKQYNFEVEQVK